MPWKELTIMEQKLEFICEWRTGNYTITELCKNFEISRPTAYKIIARFENEGYEGLKELSRKPRGVHPSSTNENVINGILVLKEKTGLYVTICKDAYLSRRFSYLMYFRFLENKKYVLYTKSYTS